MSPALLAVVVLCVAAAGCSFSFTPGKGGNAEWIGTSQQRQAAEEDRDRAIALRVRDALANDPVLAPLGLTFFVNYGEVSLCGGFPDQQTRDRAVSLVSQIEGVTGVNTRCRY